MLDRFHQIKKSFGFESFYASNPRAKLRIEDGVDGGFGDSEFDKMVFVYQLKVPENAIFVLESNLELAHAVFEERLQDDEGAIVIQSREQSRVDLKFTEPSEYDRFLLLLIVHPSLDLFNEDGFESKDLAKIVLKVGYFDQGAFSKYLGNGIGQSEGENGPETVEKDDDLPIEESESNYVNVKDIEDEKNATQKEPNTGNGLKQASQLKSEQSKDAVSGNQSSETSNAKSNKESVLPNRPALEREDKASNDKVEKRILIIISVLFSIIAILVILLFLVFKKLHIERKKNKESKDSSKASKVFTHNLEESLPIDSAFL